MTTSVAPAPAQGHVRPLFDVSRQPARRESELLTLTQHDVVWDVLSLICNQQLSQDALLLWRYDLRRERLNLLSAAPSTPWPAELAVPVSESVAQLGAQRLEALVHVQCTVSDCPLEQALADLGLHAGLTAVLSDTPTEAYLLTFGYRERWQLVSHQTSAVVAVTEYLREVQRMALPSPERRRWWEMVSLIPHLWRQPYRPSVSRTLYDLNEMLSDVADRTRGEGSDDRVQGRVARLAHQGADLMARLENVYWDPRPLVSVEEFLSEAVLLVRGAYQLCVGDWPGCMAAARFCPATEGSNPNVIRRELVDWVLGQMED